MAEAVAALGVAAAAVQFFDFSLKALSLCKEIRDSEKGTARFNQELETSIAKLKESYNELVPDPRLRAGDRPITRARNDCVAVMDDLKTLLDDVKVRSRDKNLAAVKAAFRVMRGKRRIEVLQNKLSEAQKRFLLAVSVDTKNDVAQLLGKQDKLNDSIQNTILPELRNAQTSSAADHANTQQAVTNMASASSAAHKTTHTMLKVVQQDQEASLKATDAVQVALSGDIARIEAQAESAVANAQTEAEHREIMQSLWYPEIFDRQQSIKPPSFDTFDWIFNDSPVSGHEGRYPSERMLRSREMRGRFARWLCSSAPLFWIYGKAGSGKSSLMSLIQADSRTTRGLTAWTEGRQLYTFSFYFWRPGSPLEKSTRGLLRSLLFQLAKAKPTVIDLIKASRSAHYNDWTTKSLLSALRSSLSAFHEDRIFLMIDGLDEYEDQYLELLELLLECQRLSPTKICIASRPETAILTKLQHYPSLCLQDLNENDIRIFVEGKLAPYANRIPNKLTSSLVQRAEGVFLWAALVLGSVVSGILTGDDEETIRTRVESAPSELNQLFEQLLTRVDAEHSDTLKFCLFLLNDELWQDTGTTFIRRLGLVATSLPRPTKIDNGVDLLARCLEASNQVIARCKGLIELQLGRYWLDDGSDCVFDSKAKRLVPADPRAVELCYRRTIRFIHRSAHDFFFGRENCQTGDCRWEMQSGDLQKMRQWTLEGLMTLLHHGPMSFEKYGAFTEDIAAMVGLVFTLVHETAENEGHDMHLWMDEFHKDLNFWYPVERTQLHRPANRGYVLTEKDVHLSQASWFMEYLFWKTSFNLDGYLLSRFGELSRHPHSGAICSKLMRVCCWYPYLPPFSTTYERLLAFLEEIHTGNTNTAVGHMLKPLYRQPEVVKRASWTWDASENIDEFNMIVDLCEVARQLKGHQGSGKLNGDQDPFRLMQKYKLFIGISRTKSLFLGDAENKTRRRSPHLQIQMPAHGPWVRSQQSQPTDAGSQCPEKIRFLCVSISKIAADDMHTWQPCGEDVIGMCDVRIEPLWALLEEEPLEAWDLWDLIFPIFVGSESQFAPCLKQVKESIWANENSQMDSWQQLNMLYVVEKHFRTYWRILTPEFLELAAITL